MTILQLVLGDAEVLIVGQTSIAVICSSYSEHMGLMPLTNGEEKTGSVPSSVQLTATQGPPVGSQKKIGTSKVSRCRRMKREEFQLLKCQIQRYMGQCHHLTGQPLRS